MSAPQNLKKISNGFTLIELLVVMAVIGIMVTSTVAIFTRFNQQQNLGIAHKTLKNDLAQAKSYASSHVVRRCTAGVLIGYELYRVSATAYNLREVCQPALSPANEKVWLTDKSLPNNVTFTNNFNIRFRVLSGGSPAGGNIEITSQGRDMSISVTSPEGVIQDE